MMGPMVKLFCRSETAKNFLFKSACKASHAVAMAEVRRSMNDFLHKKVVQDSVLLLHAPTHTCLRR